MIRISNLTKVYRTEQIETVALNEVSLEVEKGDFVSIMGSSGCGKSTLLNILGLLDKPAGGRYEFDRRDLLGLPLKEQSRFRKEHIGIIFQNFNLIDRLSVFDNVALPLLYAGVSVSDRKRRVNDMLERMNLLHRAAHHPRQLSGGQQQRVAVSRALIRNPQLVLADEPTGNLDSVHGNEVMELLADLNMAGTTVVLVTHSSQDASFSKRIVYMQDGQIITQKFNRAYTGDLLKTV